MADIFLIDGALQLEFNLDGTLDPELVIDGSLAQDLTIDGVIGSLYCVKQGDYEFYDGEYVISPDLSEHILDTTDKVMESDVTVCKVLMWETSNPSGGETFIIGG